MGALIRKELRAYFLSVFGYVVPVIFLFLSGFAYSYYLAMATTGFQSNPDMNVMDAVLRPLFTNFMRFLFLLIIPFMTMRSFAEEKRLGTLELLFTFPITDAQLLISKIVGAFTVVFMILVPALAYPAILQFMAHATVEWSVLASGYLGTILLCMAFVAVGLWASSITDSQVVAVVLTLGILLFFWLVGIGQQLSLPFEFQQIFKQFSLVEHFENFQKGIIDSNDVIFYVSFIAFFLFLTMKSLESRKFRG